MIRLTSGCYRVWSPAFRRNGAVNSAILERSTIVTAFDGRRKRLAMNPVCRTPLGGQEL